jgi:hypothetical protein
MAPAERLPECSDRAILSGVKNLQLVMADYSQVQVVARSPARFVGHYLVDG